MEDAITAELTYTVDTGEKPVNESYGPGNIYQRTSGTYERKAVTIRDARPMAGRLSLERNGFVLVRRPSAVRDLFSRDEVKAIYYPELVRLVQELSGASRAFVFDHTVRSGDEEERVQKLVREPVLYVHNDYTEASGPRRLRELLPSLSPGEDVESVLEKRFAIIQVWRAIRTVVSNPLALADASSIRSADLIPVERRYPDRVGETYRLRYNPGHRWYWFPRMDPDEAVVFKVFDSDRQNAARFTPHTAFIDPGAPKDAPARQSIEARLFALFS